MSNATYLWLVKISVLALDLLMAAVSSGECVRVINDLGQQRRLGSGTVVGNDLVVTCQHLFAKGVGKVSVRFPSGSVVKADLLGHSKGDDLAALRLSASVPKFTRIAAEGPKQGERAPFAGYGSGRFAKKTGSVVEYVRQTGQQGFVSVVVTGAARQGDSGGPIFNSRGELGGVLVGSDGRTTLGTGAYRIRHFLKPFRR